LFATDYMQITNKKGQIYFSHFSYSTNQFLEIDFLENLFL